MAKIPVSKTTNKVLFDTIQDLRKASNKSGLMVYRAVAATLAAPASQRVELNLSKLDKKVSDGATVIVPGKVLGSGTLSKKVTVVAFSASESAKVKIASAGGSFVPIREFLKQKQKADTKLIIIS
ncbi:50S ribosomal protein L18e [Candidatus Woesearchaeota archaeon]|nr:50S ribosomal protein L18e [Candidatus Woesearchaeota archaeon]USN44757.1 MAG: 50S ribosomal protein L18e [Candidatus Woesearchaeota archaeon]